LNVTDSLGFTGTTALEVVVNPPLVAGTITLDPSSTSTGSSVGLSVGSTGGTGPYTYSWTFGDGGVSTVATPTHVYVSPGTYPVEVTVTDALGEKSGAQASVLVTGSVGATPFSLSSGAGLYLVLALVIVALTLVGWITYSRRGRTPPSKLETPEGPSADSEPIRPESSR
jgi:PKD repeat protein